MPDRARTRRLLHAIGDARTSAAQPTRTLRGRVAQLLPGLTRAMVRLDGETTPVPVAFVSLAVELRVGDDVFIQSSEDVGLLITEVRGRDAVAEAAEATSTAIVADRGQLSAFTSLPTPDATYRHRAIALEGASGVADHVYVCRKKADDTYEWYEP